MLTRYETFCYWDCRNDIHAIIQLLFFLISVFLLFMSIRLFIQYRVKFAAGIQYIYYCLIVWAAVFCIKIVFSLLVYFIKFSAFRKLNDYAQQQTWNRNHSDDITQFSGIYLSINLICPLILQTLIFIIPYHMVRRIMRIIINFGGTLTARQKLWLSILTVYKYIRNTMYVPYILTFFQHFWNGQELEILSQTQSAMMTGDNLISCFLLIFGYRYLSQQAKQLHLQKQQYEKSLKLEFKFLTITSISRFFLISYFYIYLPLGTLTEKNDLNRPICFTKDISIVNVGYVILTPLLMHFLPVGAALYIYTPR